jgi:hypothetical protein
MNFGRLASLAYNPAQREGLVRGVLVVAVFCLAIGVGVLFAFCHGTTGFSFSTAVADTSLHIDMTTTGPAAIVGLGLTVIGSFLLIVATIIALTGMFRRTVVDHTPAKRRESAFEE